MKMHRSLKVVAAVISLATFAHAAVTPANISSAGFASFGLSFSGNSMSNNGLIVGKGAGQTGVIYNAVTGTSTTLTGPSGSTSNTYYGINNNGDVVGLAVIPNTDVPGTTKVVPFKYSGGTYTYLPTDTYPATYSFPNAYATGINNGGVAAGRMSPTNNGAKTSNTATTWAANNSFAFTALPSNANTAAASVAVQISNTGYINGTYSDTAGSTRAFVTSPTYASIDLTTLAAVSIPALTGTTPYGINDTGHTVGTVSRPRFSAGGNPAFFYNGTAVIPVFGVAAGTDAALYDINSNDIAVGYGYTATNTYASRVAMLYANGVSTDLNSLLTPNSGWVLTDAYQITDSGLVYGYGTLNGPTGTPFTLQVPEPASLGLVAVGLAMSLVRRRA